MSVKISLAILIGLIATAAVSARSSLNVVESNISARSEDGRIIVRVPVENSGAPVDAVLRVEMLDTDDKTTASSESNARIGSGAGSIESALDIDKETDVGDVLWNRIRYTLRFGGESRTGIVSVSEALPDLFSLKITNYERVSPGSRVPLRISALHPVKRVPIAGVDVSAELEIEIDTASDDDTLVFKGEARTDDSGFAEIVFLVPETVKFADDYSAEIKVKGKRNGLSDEVKDRLDSPDAITNIYYTTDKPLYQPGQTFHARALVMKRRGTDLATAIVPGAELTLTIKDEDDTVLSRQKVTTSEFGIASIDWSIPPNAKLGTYIIEADSDTLSFEVDRQSFKVSRYELPNFVVQAKPDSDFYLPDRREATVSVNAAYLFGKPVESGSVRIVREESRRWNYREQKWEIEEKAVYEGKTDAGGKYEAKIDLGPAQDEFKGDGYAKFRDLSFTAYFTDATSNRTEQRRFDLRLSKEPIHVYVNRDRRGGEANPKIPYRLYVTTFTADGKPVDCDVTVTGKYEDEQELRPIAKLRTGIFGATKTEMLVPKRADDTYYDDLEVRIEARDAEGRTGTEKFDYEIDEDEPQIRVTADRTIHRRGEPLKIEVLSSDDSVPVVVDVLKDTSAIESKRIRTKNGRATLRIPYRPEFRGYLLISAYAEDDADDAKSVWRVVYPDARRLKVSARPDKEIYRPGDEAELSLNVAAVSGDLSPTALGVAIIDQAVEERVRTDSGSAPDIFSAFWEFGADNWTELDDRKITPETQLAAEMRFFDWYVDLDTSSNSYGAPSYLFATRHKALFEPMRTALEKRFEKDFDYPVDDASLRRILNDSGVDFDKLRDPWGTEFKAEFGTETFQDLVYAVSAGPNKKFGDGDDFRAESLGFPYFKKTGNALAEAIRAYENKNATFIRDIDALRAAAAEGGVDIDALRDRWGRPYRFWFGVEYRSFTIAIESGGKNPEVTYDDFGLFFNRSDYFAATEKRISEILGRYVAESKTFPKSEPEFIELLKAKGVDLSALRDGWGRPYYFKYEESSVFADRVTIENVAAMGENPRNTMVITPVTRQIGTFSIFSPGENGTRDDYYDIGIASFAGILSERTKDDSKPKIVVPTSVFANGLNALYGVVTDANDAFVPNAEIRVINSETGVEYQAKTNSEGMYLRTGLPRGKFSVRVSASGFKTSVVNHIELDNGKLVEINFKLEAGSVSEVVTVAGATVTVDSTNASVSTVVTRSVIPIPKAVSFGVLNLQLSGQRKSNGLVDTDNSAGITIVTRPGGPPSRPGVPQPRVTPRVRDYFPETLLFVPELVTQNDGSVTFRYRMADNITTWKIYAIASDKQGRVGFTDTSVRSFQPFFVDLDPPKYLTVGDEIRLPVQVRNYTSADQKVDVTMDRADWFEFLGAGSDLTGRQTVGVGTNATANAIFGFRATGAVRDGKQRVTAIASKDSDAIEKPVTVRPDGEEIVRADSRVFTGSATLDLGFPANALPATPKAELKIYPNLLAHVTESVDGLLQRPYGCGEQTISSTYPNLMILKFRSGSSDPVQSKSPLIAKASKNLQRGYERLVGYRSADGGFSYWGAKSPSDIALTAYALRFLNEAKAFTEVDPDLIRSAGEYLVKQQRADGSWTRQYPWEQAVDLARTKMLTTYIARTLAMTRSDEKPVGEALTKALGYLKQRNAEIDEPYSIAMFGLAAFDSGDLDGARAAAARLRALAKTEGSAVFWNLETNTPFYGWGTPGRVETTAIVLQLLKKIGSADDSELIDKSMLFLLKNKDRYGVWYSTQTTINVLDGLLAGLRPAAAQTLTVTAAGALLKKIEVPADQIEPIVIDVTGKISAGSGIGVAGSADSTIMTQLVRSHYIDWKDSSSSNRDVNDSRAVELKYSCDKTTGKVMDNVKCSVSAERVGFRGYGMLLAEIGIPPGADVSRESLDGRRRQHQPIRSFARPHRRLSVGDSGRSEIRVLVQAALRRQRQDAAVGLVRLLQRRSQRDRGADEVQV